jgi:hypothetical protein
MGKYDPLRRYLDGIPPAVLDVSLSFQEIEAIIGEALPKTAWNLPQWWENDSSPSGHVQARAWLGAGWKVEAVDLGSEQVWLRRTV